MLKLVFNGIQTNIFHRFNSHLLYSTATTSTEQATHSIVDLLTNTLGFSQEEAIAASNKVSRLESPEIPISVIQYFKKIGFSQSQIKTIVSKNVQLLSIRDVNETLNPKIRVFQDLGLSGSELGDVLSFNSMVLSRKLETHIKPLIENLRSILGTDKNVVKALSRWYMLSNANLFKKVIPNVKLLRSYGLLDERIAKLVLNNPWNLICPPESLEKTLRFVEEELGISRKSGMFIYGVDAFTCCSKDTVKLKFEIFKSYGWTEEDVMTMTRNLPNCLKLSEEKIKSGLDFFMKELGYSPEYIASHPKLLKYSLQNRVFARRAVWKALIEKNLIKSNLNLYSILCITDQDFLDKYVMPYRNELPAIYGEKPRTHFFITGTRLGRNPDASKMFLKKPGSVLGASRMRPT